MTSRDQLSLAANAPPIDRDDDARALAAAVAANVTRMRTNLGIDVGTLAEWSGLKPELLRAIEAGVIAPRLRTLWALAGAFEVPFRVLVTGAPLPESAFRVARADAGQVFVSANGGFRSRALFAVGDPRQPETYAVTITPGCVEEAGPHAPDTFEHLVVLRGALTIRAERTETLGPGDVLFFRADVPHTYQNPGPDEAVVHLTMSYAGDWLPDDT